MMRIAIGCDHRGLELKKYIIDLLAAEGHVCEDFGPYTADAVDYPDYAGMVAEAVQKGDSDRGILICGTGIGMSIAANKVKGIRAALCHNVFTARRAREHNDANILCLGAEEKEPVPEIIETFMDTEYADGNHQVRIDKISAMEEGG